MATRPTPTKRGAGDGRARRQYQSPLRAQRAEETRTALIAAATRLFTVKGWVGTGMREVAAEAGVSTETLYSHFSSKRRLLDAVIDIAVVGDDRPWRWLSDRSSRRWLRAPVPSGPRPPLTS